MTNISILILTKNEQQDLPGCLENVSWSDDVHIFDSMSTDDTVAIAKRYGAHVSLRDYGECQWPFGGDESAHRNWGLKNIPFKYEWVFVIDADERATPELINAMKFAVNTHGDIVAFRVQRRDFFLDTWLKHVQVSPYYLRLFKHQKMHYERLINPISIPDGAVGQLTGFLDHFPFSKGIDYWVTRHNYYSRAEALQIIENRNNQAVFSIKKAFMAKDFNERRFHQKELFYRFPCRPLIKFIILYIWKRGFLDGRAGFTYAMLQSIYEYLIVLKTHELEKR